MNEYEHEHQLYQAYKRFAEQRRIGVTNTVEIIRLMEQWEQAGQPEDMAKFIAENADGISGNG